MKMPKEWSHNDLKKLCVEVVRGDQESIDEFWSRFSGLFSIDQSMDVQSAPFPAWVYRLGDSVAPGVQ